MMLRNSVVTRAIILGRTDFQEADRIITLLTPDHGKAKVIVKGARRQASKLAAGIELFSVSDVTFLPGSREIGTLVSSRLKTHYGNIVKDIQRTMLGYELLKRINRATEDSVDEEYFQLLELSLEGINDLDLPIELLELWFTMQLLAISGHSPHLNEDSKGEKLAGNKSYIFDFEDMHFHAREDAPFSARHIKLLRLAVSLKGPSSLKQVRQAGSAVTEALQLAKSVLSKYVKV